MKWTEFKAKVIIQNCIELIKYLSSFDGKNYILVNYIKIILSNIYNLA